MRAVVYLFFGSILVRSFPLRSKVDQNANCYHHGTWTNRDIKYFGVTAESIADYDCSLFPLATFQPEGMNGFTKIMPLCERLHDQPLVSKTPLSSLHLEWKSSCTSYSRFNKFQFVDLLAKSKYYPNGRTLYIMGDSTQEEQWISLLCKLGSSCVDKILTKKIINEMKIKAEAAWFDYDYTANKLMRKRGILVLKNGGKIVWIRTNYLVSEKTEKVEDEIIQLNRKMLQFNWTELELPWTYLFGDTEQKHQSDVLLFNSGSHIQDTKTCKRIAKQFLTWVSKNFRGIVIYRQNVPGSKDCIKKNSEKLVDGSTSTSSTSSITAFNWHLFEQFDNIWKEAASRLLPSMMHLNIREMSMLRSDSHPGRIFNQVDCLHFCLPGSPVDVWNEMLFNMLKGLFTTLAI
jgi:hypothetical protein